MKANQHQMKANQHQVKAKFNSYMHLLPECLLPLASDPLLDEDSTLDSELRPGREAIYGRWL